jgi:hypothetical protein
MTELWTRCDINAEVQNSTSYNERMYNIEYGWNGYAFTDLAVWDGTSTLFSLWDTRTTPLQTATPPYLYTPLESWYHFNVGGGGF